MSENLPLPTPINTSPNGTTVGPVILGSSDDTLVLEGATGINLVGGLNVQYNEINTGIPTFVLEDRYHFIEISNSGTTSVLLPNANGRAGKLYIISKGYNGGVLTVSTQLADKIDGDDTFILNVQSERLKLISSGDNQWLIV
jgi:hypothetical protein